MEVRSVVVGALDVKSEVDGLALSCPSFGFLRQGKSPHIVSPHSSTSFPGSKEEERGPWDEVSHSCINGYLSHTAGGTQGMD